MITSEEFKERRMTECLNELYQASQPSTTWDELVKNKGSLEHHYLSTKECKYIINKYIDLYKLDCEFKKHCDIIIRDIIEGCSIDKYIEPKDGSPGYRGYEKVSPLKEIIGEEATNKVIEFIKQRKNFYRFNHECEGFEFTMWNYSPCSNKQTVIDYWKSQGKDIEIKDRNQEYNFERYYEGASEEEIDEMIEWDKKENENTAY